ncbi:MAG: transporter [Bacteroidetes bacterium]|nr:transporter [Bacteroidota bacterium]
MNENVNAHMKKYEHHFVHEHVHVHVPAGAGFVAFPWAHGSMQETKFSQRVWQPRKAFGLRHVLVLVLVLVILTGLAQAQGLQGSTETQMIAAKPLSTDRPDQTEAAETVPAGWLQVETGAVMEQAGEDADGVAGGRVWTLPGLLLRYGLTERLELRLATAWVLEESEAADISAVVPPGTRKSITERGTEPLSIGMKYQFTRGTLPSIALIAMAALPSTVTGDFPANNPAAELRLAIAGDVGDLFSLGCNLALEHDLEESRSGLHYTAVVATGLSESVGVFVELYGSRDTGDERFRHRADGGLTWLLAPDLQWDASVGVELNPHDGQDRISGRGWFVGTGISWRFPLNP